MKEIKKIQLKTKEQYEIEELQMAMKDLVKICIRLHKEIKEIKLEIAKGIEQGYMK